MWEVNLYTYTDIKSPKKTSGVIGLVLETVVNDEPRTKEFFLMVENMSANTAELEAVYEGIKKIKTSCFLNIYTRNTYIANSFEHYLEKWSKNGWINSKGTEIANVEKWRAIEELIRCSGNSENEKITIKVSAFATQYHEYLPWLQSEAEKYRKSQSGGKDNVG